MKTISSSIVYIVCISCIVCNSGLASAQFKDDFSDGDFTHNPEWTGDAGHFEINSAGELHLNSSGSDTSVLFTRNSCAGDSEWRFRIKLSFNTSSNNNARIYLAADTSDLSAIVNSLYIQAGGADDSIFLMKQSGTILEKLYRFNRYRTNHTTNTLRFKITCDVDGNWETMIDTTGGYNYCMDGIFHDDPFTASRWFGLYCRYTSSNAIKFYFDDFYAGAIIRDTIPPVIAWQEATTDNLIRVGFSEPIQQPGMADPENYRLARAAVRPDSAIQEILHPEIVSLYFHDPIADGTIDSLQIRNLFDLPGNRLRDTTVQVFNYQPKAYDILINEIMSDPEPAVALPAGEFVELYNRSGFPIDLGGWIFTFGNTSKMFPRVIIPSKGYLLIVKDSVYLNIAQCVILFTSSYSLSNEGTCLVLKNPDQHVIHSVNYQPGWYRGSFKEDGGWSLEIIDASNPCGCQDNWEPSKDATGGTPGRENSVSGSNPDEKAPLAGRAIITDSSRMVVYFTEPMDSLSLLNAANWGLSPSEEDPDEVTHPVGVNPVPPEFTSAGLLYNMVFKKGITYNLHLAGSLNDCAGNACDTIRSTRFAIPDTLTTKDVVINEILPDPVSGGSRFVELYNRSQKIIDLQTLVIASCDTTEGIQANAVTMFESGYLLFPGDYLAVTSSREDIYERYHPAFQETIASMPGFPVLGDDSGTVIIARRDNLVIIDRMKYSKGMHYPLLSTTEGVSLERTNPDMPSDDRGNWHSASETSGFATPGYQNSHWLVPEETDGTITVQPSVFSPDNDGYDDLLFIAIRENDPDNAVSISIFDSRGRLVKQVANNVLPGSEAVFSWDGMTDERSKATIGFYVLLVEMIKPDGTVRKFKRTVVVGGKL